MNWPEDIHAAFVEHDIAQVAYVPDAGHARLIEACIDDPSIATVPLTTEEEGIALLAGAWLGGRRGALLMQSSGVGNCINMLSLAQECRFPLLLLVTMRGQFGETNPWQVPMGSITEDVLRLAGVGTFLVDAPEQVGPTVRSAATMAFSGNRSTSVILAQRLIGAKQFETAR